VGLTEKDTETLIHVTQTLNHAYRQTDRETEREEGQRDAKCRKTVVTQTKDLLVVFAI